MSNKNKIQYRRVGDYLIPNLILPAKEANITLGKWCILYKDYPEKHKKLFFILYSCKADCISIVLKLNGRRQKCMTF